MTTLAAEITEYDTIQTEKPTDLANKFKGRVLNIKDSGLSNTAQQDEINRTIRTLGVPFSVVARVLTNIDQERAPAPYQSIH